MKFAAFLTAFIAFGTSVSAQYMDMGSLVPVLTFPDDGTTDEAVTRDETIVNN